MNMAEQKSTVLEGLGKHNSSFQEAGAKPVLLSELSGAAQSNEVKEIGMPPN